MFALVDCNNFYASCERVFNPKLRNRPVIVLSNNDGCVIARSNEAKALGFKMGDAFFKVRQLVDQHQVAVFSSNYTLYGDMSSRVMQTLERFSPELEVYSIDEAFLNLAGFPADQLAAMAADIRRTVKRWTGIPVSVGIGPTKTLAKAANQLAKKLPEANGVWSIATEQERTESLQRLPVGDVWGIGRQWARFLAGHGIGDALAFSQQPDGWIRQHMHVVGLRTAAELRGTPCIPLELAPAPRKGLVVSRMFGKKLTEFEPVKQALVAYVTRAGEKLRRDGLAARHMTVFLHNSPYSTTENYFSNAASFQLAHPTSDTAELIRHAVSGLRRIYRQGPHYSKCGVMLDEFCPDGTGQGELFDARDEVRSGKLMAAVDAVNRRMGRDTVFYAGSGTHRDWKAFAKMKTGHYTTDIEQLLKVRA
ncbi:Y-family DNA polymerase [Paludisphaera borealis]|uniref:DNA polymerase V subunit UmuC n=1 Tax=Paludisphaera borealis TaxID=1387353 RepID=A0A1U7CZC7_9BACT|nr:Y-family DNA polymerase [Paludisphaera borealis]APW64310.1 DNA polymerase V subunit UmuC [Paludisphaera borealis]